LVGTEPGLADPGVGCRLAFHRGALVPRRCAAFALAELVDLRLHRGVDLGGTLGEDGDQLGGEAGDLGLPVDDREPVDPEAVGEFAAQHRLVQAAQHPLLQFQIAAVEGEPAAVDRLHLGRDHGVGVDLGVVGTRRRLPERRNRQALGVGMQPAAVAAHPCGRPEPFQIGQRRGHGDVVGFKEPLIAGQPPQHRHGLRRRKRRIESADGLDHSPSGKGAIDQRRAKLCPRDGVMARQQPLQLVGAHRAQQAERGRLTARPHPGRLARRTGQVAGVVRSRCGRRRSMNRRHPQHQTRHPIAHPGTCLPERDRAQVAISGDTRTSDRREEGKLIRRGLAARTTGAGYLTAMSDAQGAPTAGGCTGSIGV
jgi:hypothetical protein